jgi:hypothetical protein
MRSIILLLSLCFGLVCEAANPSMQTMTNAINNALKDINANNLNIKTNLTANGIVITGALASVAAPGLVIIYNGTDAAINADDGFGGYIALGMNATHYLVVPRSGGFVIANPSGSPLTTTYRFDVNGHVLLESNLTVGAVLAVGGNATVSGTSTLNSSLTVGGYTTISNSAMVDSNLNVNGFIYGSTTAGIYFTTNSTAANGSIFLDPNGILWKRTNSVWVKFGQ